MKAIKIAYRYLERQALDFKRRMDLVQEYKKLGERLEHLEKRYNIDKISDAPEAREVKKEIEDIKTRFLKILEELTP